MKKTILPHTMKMRQIRHEQNKNGLIAILKEVADLAILKNEGWYRIPVKSAPSRWPPKWLAFYQPKPFEDEAYQIKYYGTVKEILKVKRYELFPNELPSNKSEQEYFKIFLDELEERSSPILSARPRRLVFIPTTREKFDNAVIINDLFDESPLEDKLWLELQNRKIDAERQWRVLVSNVNYYLDFAIFCRQGQIDIETDGDTYHMNRSQVLRDNARDNALQLDDWMVLRFNSKQIKDHFDNECLGNIQNGINRLGGLTTDNIVPRVFYNNGGQHSQQMTLFDKTLQGYRLEREEESDIDLENY